MICFSITIILPSIPDSFSASVSISLSKKIFYMAHSDSNISFQDSLFSFLGSVILFFSNKKFKNIRDI